MLITNSGYNPPSYHSILAMASWSSHLSVNRPPTPEPEPDAQEKPQKLSVEEIVEVKLIRSGEKDRLKELLRSRLVESGWEDNLLDYCLQYLKSADDEEVSLEDLIRAVTPKGRATVPVPVKAELLQRIKACLTDDDED